MSVRMRHTRAHTRNRRSHHGLEEPRFSVCSKCGAKHIRHQACMSCGTYRGRVVIDVAGQTARKLERKERKLKERGEDPTATRATQGEDKESAQAEKPLDPAELSKK